MIAVLSVVSCSDSHVVDPVGDLVASMEGTFESDATVESEESMPTLRDRRVRVAVPALGENVVYWQLNSGPEQDVYRQRLLVFESSPNSDEIIQTTWTFLDPDAFVDAFDAAPRFATLTKDDLKSSLPDSCAQVWKQTEDGWFGNVNPDDCRIWSERRESWRRIGSEMVVLENELLQAERGFDDEGAQVFGTPPGEYHRLRRVAQD